MKGRKGGEKVDLPIRNKEEQKEGMRKQKRALKKR